MKQHKEGMKKPRTKKGKAKKNQRSNSRSRKPEKPPEIKEWQESEERYE